MTKNRLIASLLIYNGNVVQTRRFKRTNMVGSAFTAVDFFNTWTVDEIVALDISYSDSHSDQFVDIVWNLSRRCFVPLSVGGKISDIEQVKMYTRAGADKVVVNTAAVDNPRLLREVSDNYGTQCLVISIDALPNGDMASGYEVVVGNGKKNTGVDVMEHVERCCELGAGEIMINSLENDGNRQGYDLELVRMVSDGTDVPVIAFGGVGEWEHLVAGIRDGHAQAAAAGNIFHYTEHSTKKAKEYMLEAGLPMRQSHFYNVDMPRLPEYEPYLNK